MAIINITAGDSRYMQPYTVDATNQTDIYPLIKALGNVAIQPYRADVPVTLLSSKGQVYATSACNGKITNLGTNTSVAPYYEFDNTNAKYSTIFVLSYATDWTANDGLNKITIENVDAGDSYVFDSMSGYAKSLALIGGASGTYGKVLAIGLPNMDKWKRIRVKCDHTGSFIHAFVGMQAKKNIFPWEKNVEKFLVNHGGNLKKWNGTAFDVVQPTSPDTDSIALAVKTNGMTSIPPKSALDTLSLPYSICYWTDDTGKTQAQPKLTAVPFAQLRLPVSLINLTDTEKLSSIVISATESGAGKNRYVVSTDLQNWKAYTGGAWQNIGTLSETVQADADKVIAQGMTKAQVNALTWTELSQLYAGTPDGKPDYIAIAYASDISSSTDAATNDNVNLIVDLRGALRKAKDSEWEGRYWLGAAPKFQGKQLVASTFVYLYQE